MHEIAAADASFPIRLSGDAARATWTAEVVLQAKCNEVCRTILTPMREMLLIDCQRKVVAKALEAWRGRQVPAFAEAHDELGLRAEGQREHRQRGR